MWRSIAMLCALCLSCRCVLLSVGIVAAPGVVCLNRASSRGRARVVCCCDTAGARRTSTLPHLPQPGRLRGGRGKGLLALLAFFRALFGLFWMPFGGLPSQGEPRWVGGGVRCSVKQAGFFFPYMFLPTAGLVRTGTLSPLPTWRLLPPSCLLSRKRRIHDAKYFSFF